MLKDGVSELLALYLEADLPPIDWVDSLAAFPVAGTERDHYEVAHRWAGSITVPPRIRRSYDSAAYAWVPAIAMA